MQPLILLHGAIGAADQLEPISSALNDQYNVHTIDFSGHGKMPDNEDDFSIALFARDVIAYMETKGMERASFFGYSMGGYVALYLAKHRPEKVDSLVTLATKLHWDESTAASEAKMLDADKLEAKVPAFAQALQQRHEGKDWKRLLRKTVDMLHSLGRDNTLTPEDYSSIQARCLLLLGDRDKMVTLEETVAVYRSLPGAAMGMLPNTPHPIEQINLPALAFMIRQFLG